LDIRVLCNVLDAFFNTVQTVTGDTQTAFDAFVVRVALANLVRIELKDESDKLTYGNDGGTEGDGALVVNGEPPDRSADVSRAASV